MQITATETTIAVVQRDTCFLSLRSYLKHDFASNSIPWQSIPQTSPVFCAVSVVDDDFLPPLSASACICDFALVCGVIDVILIVLDCVVLCPCR